MVKPPRPAYAYTDFVKDGSARCCPIETARLRLRRFVPGDVAGLHAIHSRADVTRWLI